eukprot:1179073-Prorocentrum_minimum.AAC.1
MTELTGSLYGAHDCTTGEDSKLSPVGGEGGGLRGVVWVAGVPQPPPVVAGVPQPPPVVAEVTQEVRPRPFESLQDLARAPQHCAREPQHTTLCQGTPTLCQGTPALIQGTSNEPGNLNTEPKDPTPPTRQHRSGRYVDPSHSLSSSAQAPLFSGHEAVTSSDEHRSSGPTAARGEEYTHGMSQSQREAVKNAYLLGITSTTDRCTHARSASQLAIGTPETR